MECIKITFLTIIMTCAAIPAWGMDYLKTAIQLAAPMIASPYIFSAMNKGALVSPEPNDHEAARNILNWNFTLVSYDAYRPQEIKIWKKDDEVQGILIHEKLTATMTHIRYLAVKDELQSTGIGTAMLDSFEKEVASQCPSRTCELNLKSRRSALKFYRKNGFTCNDYYECIKEFASTMSDLQSMEQQND